MWKTVLKFIENIIFPEQCIHCKKIGQYLCDDCLSLIEIIETPVCPYCHLNRASLEICQKHHSYLDGMLIAADYSNQIVARAIKLLKYEPCARKLAPYLTKILIYTLLASQNKSLLSNQIISFVPIHKQRENVRGFNQAQLLATLLAKECDAVCLKTLIKSKPTPHQTKLSKEQRQNNIKDSFQIAPDSEDLIAGKLIILIDDVFTTGATLEECAKILKKYGAHSVIGLTVAGEIIN